jgi:FtsP/CotA-like multicopper oxidase with cupredoxin domain
LTARWTEDNPGRWLYHCHVASHQDFGMAGWYIVEQ